MSECNKKTDICKLSTGAAFRFLPNHLVFILCFLTIRSAGAMNSKARHTHICIETHTYGLALHSADLK